MFQVEPLPNVVGPLVMSETAPAVMTPLHRFQEPAEVKHREFQDFGPYTLHVVDRSHWWKSWERYQVCEIRIVRGNDDPGGYGHYSGYTFHNYNSQPDYFTRCACEWKPNGVSLTEPTGHTLFIPASAFTGGR